MLLNAPTSHTAILKRRTLYGCWYGMAALLVVLASCRNSPKEETISTAFAQDSAIPTQITILADLPDSLQPTIIELANTPAPEIISIPEKAIQFTFRSKAGLHKVDIQPTEKTKASFSTVLQQYTTEQGLSQDVLSCIKSDRKGNLWIGTASAGISKFDGNTFINYTSANGLVDNGISNIYEDRSGNIWISTVSGLSKFDGHTFTTFENGKCINNFLEDSAGNRWLCTSGYGLYKHAGDTIIQYTEANGLPGNVNYIAEGKNGIFWLATTQGVFSFNGIEFTQISQQKENAFVTLIDKQGNVWAGTTSGYLKYDGTQITRFPLPVAPLRHIYEDRLGNIWMDGQNEGVWYYDGHALHAFHHQSTGYASAEDHSGNLWFCTPANGIIKYSGSAFQQLSPHSIRSIFEDNRGHIWFSGYSNGINLFDGTTITNIGIQTSFWCMYPDRSGNIWGGCMGSGLIKFDGQRYTFYTDLHGLPDPTVQFITQDSQGYMWIGTPSGLCKFDGNSFTNFSTKQGLASSSVSCILPDESGKLLLGTENGLSIYDGKSFVNYNISSLQAGNDIRSMIKDQSGNLWIGTYGGGIIRYDGTSFISFTADQGLPDNTVTQLSFTKEGHLIAGTDSGIGLLTGFSSHAHNGEQINVQAVSHHPTANNLSNKLLSDHFPQFEIYNTTTGFPVMDVNRGQHAIAADSKGFIWIASGAAKSGMLRFDYSALYKNNNPPTVEITSVRIENEIVCWNNLFNYENPVVNPNSSALAMTIPAILTEEVFLYGKVMKDTQRSDLRNKLSGIGLDSIGKFFYVPYNLTLPYNQNSIAIDFAAIEPSKPSLVQYQYMLEGYDDTWSTPSNIRTANFGNMYEGTYRFQLKARSPSGVWSDPVTYMFTVRPPVYRTWWAYSIYLLLFAAILYGIFLLLKKRVQLRATRKAEHEEAIRLKELDTFKSQLFTNLTHEFRTPLTVILGMAKQLTTGTWQSVVGQKEKTRVERGLQLIENNGQNLLQLINQLLDLSKLENKSFKLNLIQSDIIHYLRYVTESFHSLAEQIELSLRFSTDQEEVIMDFDPEQIKQVMTNLISNALKFTPSGGEVIVAVSASKDKLEFLVKDTGIGISQKDLPHILDRFYQADSSTTRVAQGTGIGLAHTQELLNVMNGSIAIDSELGKGTSVYIRLPIRHDATVTEVDEIASSPKPFIPVVSQLQKQQTQELHPVAGNGSSDTALPQLLIIEDNRDVVTYLRSCLDDSYDIAVAYDGITGAEVALESIPDIIISDVMMPGLDGFQVCDQLKSDERTSHIPLILLTAKADAVSRLTGLRRGADAYMAKPFSPDELTLQIATLLDNRRRVASHFSKQLLSLDSPMQPDEVVIDSIRFEHPFIKKVNAILATYYSDENFGIPELSDQLSMSRVQLFRKLKAIADTSPSDLIRSFRLSKAKALLESGMASVSEAAYQSGFRDPSYFSKLFQDEFGVQPREIK